MTHAPKLAISSDMDQQATAVPPILLTRDDLLGELAGDYMHRVNIDDMNIADLSVRLTVLRRRPEVVVPDEIQADDALLADLIAWIEANGTCAECCEVIGSDALCGYPVYCSERCRDDGEFSPPDGEGYDWGR